MRPPDEEVEPVDPGAAPDDRRDDRDQRRAPEGRRTREERVAEFDADGDGKLTGEERDAMRKARTNDQLGRMDQDGDGELSPAELESQKRFRTVDFAAADTDRNGSLSTEELDAVIARQRGQGGGIKPERRTRFRTRDGGDAGVR